MKARQWLSRWLKSRRQSRNEAWVSTGGVFVGVTGLRVGLFVGSNSPGVGLLVTVWPSGRFVGLRV
jgi:hypothetical protein